MAKSWPGLNFRNFRFGLHGKESCSQGRASDLDYECEHIRLLGWLGAIEVVADYFPSDSEFAG